MNNQIYKILQLNRKNLNPPLKFQLIYDYCQKLINISKQRGIHFYIVLDAMTFFSTYFEYDFEKEYSFLQPFRVKLSNGFLQVYQGDTLHAINLFSKTNYIKPYLEKKVNKNKKDAAELKKDIQNGGVVKNDNHSFLLASKYNYYLYESLFANVKNIELFVANTEADFKMAQIAKRLIQQGVPANDICIHSQDTDLLVLQTGVAVQQGVLLLEKCSDVSSKLKYYYLHSSDYISRSSEPQKSIMQELNQPTSEEERQQMLFKACQNRELNILIADMLFQHYDIIEKEQQYSTIARNEIKHPDHVKLVFEIYEQFQFNTYFQNIRSIKPILQQNLYFQEVMSDQWVNLKLSQKEYILKLYFTNKISYETLVERWTLIEQEDLEKRNLV